MKKLNLFVGVLVAAALLLLLGLFIMSIFTGGNKDAPATSSTPPTATATATPPPSGDTTEMPPLSTEAPATPTIAPLEGETLALEAFIGRETLTFTYSSSLFTRVPTEIGEQFFLKSDPSNDTFIEIVFIEADLELRKASFLDSFIPDFTEMDTLGQILVAGSDVAAEGLSATNGTRFVEAWLIKVEGGFFAVVAGYPDDASRAELYRMLDTLTFSL